VSLILLLRMKWGKSEMSIKLKGEIRVLLLLEWNTEFSNYPTIGSEPKQLISSCAREVIGLSPS
jgi:hypothetical protein